MIGLSKSRVGTLYLQWILIWPFNKYRSREKYKINDILLGYISYK